MIKALVGYTLVESISPEEYHKCLWEIHTPDLLCGSVHPEDRLHHGAEACEDGERGHARVPQSLKLYRIAEMHFRDLAAYEAYRAWFKDHPNLRRARTRGAFRTQVLPAQRDGRGDAHRRLKA